MAENSKEKITFYQYKTPESLKTEIRMGHNNVVKLGFKDVSRLENDPHFNNIKSSHGFNEAVSKIKAPAK